MKKLCFFLVVGSVLNSNFPIFKGGKIGTSRFSYFQGFGSQHHLARMHLTSFWARTLYQQDIDMARATSSSSINTLGLFFGGGDDATK